MVNVKKLLEAIKQLPDPASWYSQWGQDRPFVAVVFEHGGGRKPLRRSEIINAVGQNFEFRLQKLASSPNHSWYEWALI